MLRADGAVQPGIPFGKFVIRIPFIHYRIERAEVLSGIIMSAACMSAIPLIQEVLEIPYEIAWSIVILNGMLYLLHCLLGDPVSPGWITPSIPVTMAYLLSYDSGPDRLNPLPAEASRFLLRLKSQFRLKPVAMRLKPAEATAHRRLCGTHHREAYPGVQCNP